MHVYLASKSTDRCKPPAHRGELGCDGSERFRKIPLCDLHGDLHPALGARFSDGIPFGTHIETCKHRWAGYHRFAADFFPRGVAEEIVISGRYASVGLNEPATAADRRAATRWLQHFGIEPLRERKPRQVSYGQMRIALLARAMINDPDLLLLDEPCTGLDADMRKRILTCSRTRERRHSL